MVNGRTGPRIGGRKALRHDALTSAVVAAQLGDESAFRVLFRAVQPGLLRYLSVLVGSDAEEVAAQTWQQVVRELAGFSGSGEAFRGWVVTIARSRGLDLPRARERRPFVPEPAHHDSPRGNTDAEAMSTQQALSLIRTLPQDQAEAVLLRVVVGLDLGAAATVLGKRSGTVRIAASRGLRRLAELLNGTLVDQTGKGGAEGVAR